MSTSSSYESDGGLLTGSESLSSPTDFSTPTFRSLSSPSSSPRDPSDDSDKPRGGALLCDDPFLSSLYPHLVVLSSTNALAHLDHLTRQADSMVSMNHLPGGVCEQIHLGVVSIPAFQALMAVLNAIRHKLPPLPPQHSQDGAAARKGAAARASQSMPQGHRRLPTDAAPRAPAGSGHHEEGMDIAFVNGFVHTANLAPSDESLLPSSAAYPSSASDSQPPRSTSPSPLPAPPSALSSTSTPAASSPSSASARASPTVERDRFCKPSRLITAYSSKPFLMTPIHLERQYVTSRKNLDGMSAEDKAELCTVTVRWMGKAAVDELFLVATDVCALINIRKSNTAKTVAQFSDAEKVSMPVHCSSGKGSSTHILTVLTMAGVRRLLTSSRSVLSSALLDYLNRITQHIHAYPHYVPVNDPTKPSVVPFLKEPTAIAATAQSSAASPTAAAGESATASAVKAEAVAALTAWEGAGGIRQGAPHSRSTSASVPSSGASSPSSHPQQSSASSPTASSPTRSVSLSGRKQHRGRAAGDATQQKRMKEEREGQDVPPQHASPSVQQLPHPVLMEDAPHPDDAEVAYYVLARGGFAPHALHQHSQSPPLPPPAAGPPTFVSVGYQPHSPSTSPYFVPGPAHAPHMVNLSLSPPFGPASAPTVYQEYRPQHHHHLPHPQQQRYHMQQHGHPGPAPNGHAFGLSPYYDRPRHPESPPVRALSHRHPPPPPHPQQPPMHGPPQSSSLPPSHYSVPRMASALPSSPTARAHYSHVSSSSYSTSASANAGGPPHSHVRGHGHSSPRHSPHGQPGAVHSSSSPRFSS